VVNVRILSDVLAFVLLDVHDAKLERRELKMGVTQLDRDAPFLFFGQSIANQQSGFGPDPGGNPDTTWNILTHPIGTFVHRFCLFSVGDPRRQNNHWRNDMTKKLRSTFSLRTLPTAVTLCMSATLGVAQAQSFENPIEIDDCTTIENVSADSWYVLTKDLEDCPGAAIHVKNNTGRVLIDLNGRTLSSTSDPAQRLSVGVWIQDSPAASVKGNYHHRADSGAWGATMRGFQVAVAVEHSEDVSIGYSGVANGGIYMEDNNYGVRGVFADRLYLSNFAVRDSAMTAIDIYVSDAPLIRSVGVLGGKGGFGLRLHESPDARIWGNSGRVGDNAKGIEVGVGSDNAHIYSWQANRAVSVAHS